jgi:hypothetical protein
MFRELVQLLLSRTIIKNVAAVRLTQGPRTDQIVRVLGGWSNPLDPLPLNDDRYLRFSMTLFLENTAKGPRVKVAGSSIQYQFDKGGDSWVFRYDYNREAPDKNPSAHLHVRGCLTEQCLGNKQALEHIHFPTDRVSFETVIRLVIEQFNVLPHNPAEIWRPLLAESEVLFLQIAHKSLSGPVR